MRSSVSAAVTVLAVAIAVVAAAGAASPARAQDEPLSLEQIAKVAGELAGELAKGEALWRSSCPLGSPPMGLCIADKVAKHADYCTGSHTEVTVRRKSKPAGRARKHFTRVVELAGTIPDRAPEAQDARRAAVQARFYLAQGDIETMLALTYPTRLAFTAKNQRVRERAEKQFREWMSSTQKTYSELRTRLGELADENSVGRMEPQLAVTASAYIGDLTLRFAGFLEQGWIPGDVRTGEWAKSQRETYCEGLATTAASLRRAAAAAYQGCMDMAGRLSVRNDATSRCVRGKRAGK